uniref:Transposable element P transposase n=1 Tax=Strigamia maritima TaxID=126957 RepID=T1ITN3_STRMM
MKRYLKQKSYLKQKMTIHITLSAIEKKLKAAETKICVIQRKYNNLLKMKQRLRKQKQKVLNDLARERLKKLISEKKLLSDLPRKERVVVKMIILLKIKSPKGYRHCAKHNLLPLPSVRSLQRLLRGVKCTYGLNMRALDAIKTAFAEISENNRIGVIIFDEIKLRETIDFNQTTYKFDGFVDLGEFTPTSQKQQLADHALVFMFVPFKFNWVQPIAVFASRGCTTARVIGFTCDGATSNKKAWQELGISGNLRVFKNSFTHPLDANRKVFAFGDQVHEFKCIRNNLEKKEICQYKGQLVKYKFFEDLYNVDVGNAGRRVVPRLTEAHINPTPFQKMSVKLAVQLLSRSVACGLKFYRSLGMHQFRESESTEMFAMDMNCFLIYSIRNYLRKLLKEFDVILSDVENNFATRQTLESLRVTVRSMLEMAEYLWDTAEFSYILTSKTNQDAAEMLWMEYLTAYTKDIRNLAREERKKTANLKTAAQHCLRDKMQMSDAILDHESDHSYSTAGSDKCI